MKHITASHLEPILKSLATPFDTHQLEGELLRRDSHAFASELLEHRDVTVFSNQFARWFDREFGGTGGKVRQTRKVASPSLVGTQVQNQEWEKVSETPQS
jgi:hypothetical protein